MDIPCSNTNTEKCHANAAVSKKCNIHPICSIKKFAFSQCVSVNNRCYCNANHSTFILIPPTFRTELDCLSLCVPKQDSCECSVLCDKAAVLRDTTKETLCTKKSTLPFALSSCRPSGFDDKFD